MEESNRYRSSDMRYEWNRLATFNEFPCPESVSVLRLAQSGFYFTGHGSICRCFSCDFVHCDWTNGHIPSHCEQRDSDIPMSVPNESTIYLETINALHLPNSSTPASRHEENRAKLFQILRLPTVSDNNSFPISSTTENILPQQGTIDYRPCSAEDEKSGDSSKILESCKSNSSGQTCTTTRYMLPRHRRCRPVRRYQSPSNRSNHAEGAESMCPSGSRHPSSETERRFSLPEGHLILSSAVRNTPGIAQTYRERLSTFHSWPAHLQQTPERMAVAGFFYLGYSDAVQCSFCNGQLRDWQETDDPRSKHAQKFPDCKFVRQHSSEPSNQPEGSQVDDLTDEQIAHLPASIETQDLSFELPDIVNACRELSNTLDLRVITKVDILKYLYEENETQEDRFSGDDRSLCCVCFARVVSVLFLPCRHGCCTDCRCTRHLDYCPRCDSLIKTKLKVYI